MQKAKKITPEAMELAESAREARWVHPSFVAELFYGRVKSSLIFPFPEQDKEDRKLGDEFILKLQDFLLDHVDGNEIDRSGEIPQNVIDGLIDLGAFGMKIEKKYGGLGFSYMNYIRALTYVGGHCGNIAAWLSAHQSIGVPQPLKLFGTEAQKEKFLPRLVREISAFALTEPGVGSDPAEMSLRAEPSADGSHWILNGRKLWCTNGAVAKLIVVMARTPDIFVNGKAKKQISALIVESSMPGFKVLHRCRFMGLHGIQNALIEFKDVKVPMFNLIGKTGEGLKIALTTLNTGRLSLPAICLGTSKKCLEVMRHWTNGRRQWGTKIGHHEEIASKSSRAMAGVFAMEAVTHWASLMADKGGKDLRLEASMAKLFATEMNWKIIYDTLQTRGGRGYENASSLEKRGEPGAPVERCMRDARVNTILEGSTEIMHLLIAREALDVHLRGANLLLDPKAAISLKLKTFVTLFFKYLLWYPKLWFSFSFLKYTNLNPVMASHMRYVDKTSRRLSRSVFHMLLIHRLGLEKRQLILGRLVEIGTELFVMALSCSKAQSLCGGQKHSNNAIEVAHVFCLDAKERIRNHFSGLYCNHDKKYEEMSKNLMDGSFKWLEEGTISGNINWGTKDSLGESKT